MEFKYPTKLTDFNLNTITQHKHGRSVSDKSIFASLKIKAFVQKKLRGKTNYITAYYEGNYSSSYRAALHVAATDAVAASLVAHMSFNGIGCEKDISQANHWTKIAAEGGEPIAMARFGKSILESSPALAFRLMKDSFIAGNDFAGILLLDSALSVPALRETPAFKEIESKLFENATSAAQLGFTKAGELLSVYKSTFPA